MVEYHGQNSREQVAVQAMWTGPVVIFSSTAQNVSGPGWVSILEWEAIAGFTRLDFLVGSASTA